MEADLDGAGRTFQILHGFWCFCWSPGREWGAGGRRYDYGAAVGRRAEKAARFADLLVDVDQVVSRGCWS